MFKKKCKVIMGYLGLPLSVYHSNIPCLATSCFKFGVHFHKKNRYKKILDVYKV